ncbi:MAG: retropepsin-like aspartic protease [Phycisphaerales bacterium]
MRSLCTIGLFASVLLLSSCATTQGPAVVVPIAQSLADAAMNEDVGCGGPAVITVRLDDGQELPFVVDTGSPMTVLDKSLEPKLGQCLGTATLNNFGVLHDGSVYAAPRLYLGELALATGATVVTSDLIQKSFSDEGLPVLGILGMDCMRHYCIQFDFSIRKMRFLDPNHIEAGTLGRAYSLTFSSQGNTTDEWVRPYIHHSHLVGDDQIDVLVDTGYGADGALEPAVLRREIQAHTLRAERETNDANEPKAAYLAECTWSGERYKKLMIGNGRNTKESDGGENSLGLWFLARHLVTFDFPHGTMYLKKTRSGPLVNKEWNAETMAAGRSAFNVARKMIKRGQLPGWSKEDPAMTRAMARLHRNPDTMTLGAKKKGDSSTYRYEFTRPSKDDPWKLRRAWRTDQDDRTPEEYPVP